VTRRLPEGDVVDRLQRLGFPPPCYPNYGASDSYPGRPLPRQTFLLLNTPAFAGHTTERRVLHGEAIAANEKIVSLFEPHADIIVKGGREVQYGHKLNLTTGRSGLILDLVIEAGNPAYSERFLPMLKRHIAFYGEAPRQAAADGGFASRHNLGQAKALGVRDLAFHKKAGLRIKDMVKSNWVYRKLRNFRAGIESDISCLKRAYGLACCIWRGLDHFRAYIWSSVVAYNLALFARLKPI